MTVTIETIELKFDNHGVAKFPHHDVIFGSVIMSFAIPETEGTTITGYDLISSAQRKICKLTLKKNSATIVKGVPVPVFAPTSDRYFFDDLGDIQYLDLRNCEVKYTGDNNDVKGKALEIVFKYLSK